MPDSTDEFYDDLDHYSQEVSVARHQDFARFLRQWFRVLEESPEPIRTRVKWLLTHFSTDKLEKEVIFAGTGMVGSGRLIWPDNLEDRLAAQLALLRRLTEKEDSAWQFAFDFFYDGNNNIDSTLGDLVEHLFQPHVRELRRHLLRSADKPLGGQTSELAPASDRLVRLDDNQPQYRETIDAIAKVGDAAEGSNEIVPEDRERIKFELNAGMLLLKASSARVDAIEAVLIRALQWLSANFAGAALGIAAEHALLAVLRLVRGG